MRPLKALLVVLLFSLTACQPVESQIDDKKGGDSPVAEEEVITEAPVMEDGVDTPSSELPACYHPYFPVRDGVTWTYKMSDTVDGEDTYTLSYDVTGPENFVVVMSFDDMTINVDWVCTEEGLVRADYAEFLTGFDEFVLEEVSFSGVNLPLREQMIVGESWQNSFTASGSLSSDFGEASFTLTMVMDNLVEAIENVDVPAGSFEAVRVKTVYSVENGIVVAGITTPVTTEFIATTWYAQDVGMVKSDTETMGIQSVVELVSMD